MANEIFESGLVARSIVSQRSLNSIGMIQRRSHQKIDVIRNPPIDVDAVTNSIMNIVEHQLIDELPMSA